MPAECYEYAPAGRYGYVLRDCLRGDMHIQCKERLHALGDLLGFRDASFEFGDAFGVAWVGAEEVAAS